MYQKRNAMAWEKLIFFGLAHFSQLEGRFSLSAGDFWVAWWADCQSRSQKEDVWDFRREPLIVFLPKMILFQKSSAGALKNPVWTKQARIFGPGTKAIREKMPPPRCAALPLSRAAVRCLLTVCLFYIPGGFRNPTIIINFKGGNSRIPLSNWGKD